MKYKRIIYILCLCFLVKLINAQVADFRHEYLGKRCDSVEVKFTDESVSATSYKWFIGSDSVSNLQHPTLKFYPGIYTVKLEINDNKDIRKDTIIEVHTSPEANFNVTRLKHTGYYARFFTDTSITDTINTSIPYTYIIDYGDNSGKDSINIDTLGFFHKYSDEGNYDVVYIARDNFNCADTVEQTITIDDTTELYTPNVFTPNDDKVNDIFIIEGNGVTNLKIEIFNRYGVLVYRNTSPIITWDGKTLAGIEAPSGVYFYVLTSEDGKTYDNEPVKNTVYLIR